MSDTAFEGAVEPDEGFGFDDSGAEGFEFDDEDEYGLEFDDAGAEFAEPPSWHGPGFEDAVRRGIAESLGPLYEAVGGWQDESEFEPEPAEVVSEEQIGNRVADTLDQVAAEHGAVDRSVALEAVAAAFNELLESREIEDVADIDEAFEDALVEGATDALAQRDGTPVINKLVQAELVRVGELGNDLVSDQVSDLANDIVESLLEAGYDPQSAAADAVRTAATAVTGRLWAASNPNPTTIANYFAGQQRGLNAMNALNRRAEERSAAAARPPGPVLGAEALARKYANRVQET